MMLSISSIQGKYFIIVSYTYTYRRKTEENLIKIFSSHNIQELQQKLYLLNKSSQYKNMVILYSNIEFTIPSVRRCINCGRVAHLTKLCGCGVEKYEYL